MNPRKQLKRRPEFMKLVREHMHLDPGGVIKTQTYANLVLNICWDGKALPVPYSHVVWFLSKGDWPREGYVLDHINDDPLDNRIENLREVTEAENHMKRRGRKVYRSYGKGKYGYGMGVFHDKRDGRFYVSRHLSRGHGDGELKTRKYALGGFDTLEAAEKAVAEHIEILKEKGLDYSE